MVHLINIHKSILIIFSAENSKRLFQVEEYWATEDLGISCLTYHSWSLNGVSDQNPNNSNFKTKLAVNNLILTYVPQHKFIEKQ